MRLILNEFTSHLSDITSISPKPLHFGHEEIEIALYDIFHQYDFPIFFSFSLSLSRLIPLTN